MMSTHAWLSGEFLILLVAGLVAWGIALAVYLPTIQIRKQSREQEPLEFDDEDDSRMFGTHIGEAARVLRRGHDDAA